LLDAHAGLLPLAQNVAAAFIRWQQLSANLADRRSATNDRAAELELLKFQATELETLALEPGEAASLRQERDKLANTDRLIGGVSAALERLSEGDVSAYRSVVFASQEVGRLAEHDPELREAAEHLSSIEIELRDVESSLTRYRDRIEADPARLEWLEERLAKIRKLARRHGVADDELPSVLPSLRSRIAELDGGAETLEALAAETEKSRAEYFAHAATLSAGRAKHAKGLGRKVTAELAELGMPHGEFRVDIQPKDADRADGTGLERVEFQVRLNPGQPFGPLARMASGGELSRISLAIEVVRSGASPVPSFVFDEVDAGVGGRVAEIVGRKLAGLAATRQVLCVTHLPQVASQGANHYRVVKMTDGKTSRTQVRRLTAEERVEELSRMLGGIEITERTRAHAAEMIDRAAR
jgi:DNA repair protein RecN (Recombination protein N)